MIALLDEGTCNLACRHEWAVAERRYLSEESMGKLKATIEEEVPLAITA